MPTDDRDPQFERALAQHLRGGSSQANCPDAEILAAYHDRTLSLDEMAQWKQHIVSCAACQETLALVESSERQLSEKWDDSHNLVLDAVSGSEEDLSATAIPTQMPSMAKPASVAATPAASEKPVTNIRQGRRSAALRWGVPLGAVAAGLLLWIGIHQQRAAHVSKSENDQLAQNQPLGPREERAETPAPPPPPAEQSMRQAQTDTKTADQSSPMNGRNYTALNTPVPPAKTDALTKDAESVAKESGARLAAQRPALIPPAPPPAATSAPKIPSVNETVSVTSEAGPVAALTQPAPPLPSGSTAGGTSNGAVGKYAARVAAPEDKKNQSTTVETQKSAQNLDTSSMMMKQGMSSESLEVVAPDLSVILTPDSKVFYRLQPGGKVQLTTNGGKNWKSLKTGVTSDLLTGTAPSAEVCWIAGKAGTLLLTTDRGGHWTRITSPITGDLGGVHASDALHASIWDASNRTSYETSDGGLTWKQVANE
jgi:hypothetical protein